MVCESGKQIHYLKGEDIRKNSRSVGTQWNFGKEQRPPLGEPHNYAKGQLLNIYINLNYSLFLEC